MKQKICVFTGTRAEYGILKPFISLIDKDRSLILQLLVSGTHLSRQFGHTCREIENDGFIICKRVDISLNSDTPLAVSRSMGLGIMRFSEAYNELRPDIIVILGDRFEALAAAVSAMILRIPISHLHGGEATFGLIDEAVRHSITKMSHLHFTSTEEYRKRVIQLGENPNRVYNVGALSLDNIENSKLLSRGELEKRLGIVFGKINFLTTFHPVTLKKDYGIKEFKNLLAVLDHMKDAKCIFTRSNADSGGRAINNMINRYVRKNKRRAVVFASMGKLNYLSAMRYVDAILGNSSSGIIEAPFFNLPVLNIGDRQAGRVRAGNVIDCGPTYNDIGSGLSKLLSPSFRTRLKTLKNPYKKRNGADKVRRVIKKFLAHNRAPDLKKVFFDIKHGY